MGDEFEQKAKSFDISGAVATSIITALSFTVGLFWKDVISHTISEVLPESQTLFYEYIAALAVTLLAVLVSFFILKTAEEARKIQLRQQRRLAASARRMREKALIAKKHHRKRFIKRFRKR